MKSARELALTEEEPLGIPYHFDPVCATPTSSHHHHYAAVSDVLLHIAMDGDTLKRGESNGLRVDPVAPAEKLWPNVDEHEPSVSSKSAVADSIAHSKTSGKDANEYEYNCCDVFDIINFGAYEHYIKQILGPSRTSLPMTAIDQPSEGTIAASFPILERLALLEACIQALAEKKDGVLSRNALNVIKYDLFAELLTEVEKAKKTHKHSIKDAELAIKEVIMPMLTDTYMLQ